jgi:hypothetical protein
MFKGSDPTLPTLNYGAGLKENRPIEFLQLFGEYCAINYNECIALAFRTSPPAFGDEEPEPTMPDPIPNTNAGKALLADYTNDRKEWKADAKKTRDQKRCCFAKELSPPGARSKMTKIGKKGARRVISYTLYVESEPPT